MKTKQCLLTVKELVSDIYMSVFDDKYDVDELMKLITKSIDFFKTYCCNTTASQDLVKGGNPPSKSMHVVFENDTFKRVEDLTKSSVVNKIISTINTTIAEYLKRNDAKSLLLNCTSYYNSLKRFSKSSCVPYNFSRLDNLLIIMNEIINYDSANNNSFTWAATSFLFHIIYIDIVSSINVCSSINHCIVSTDKNDQVSSLANLFESKKLFVNQFMVEILPKMLSFHTKIIDSKVYFYGSQLAGDQIQPLVSIIQHYTDNTINADIVRMYLLNHGHTLIQHVTNPMNITIYGGLPPLSNSVSSNELTKVISSEVAKNLLDNNASLSNLTNLVPRPSAPSMSPNNVVAKLMGSQSLSSLAPNHSPQLKPRNELGNRLPSDKDYKKIILMKFFALLEKCVQAYKEKKPPATSMVVNVFEGTRGISIKDGQVIVKKL